jgi:hypothetical protein
MGTYRDLDQALTLLKEAESTIRFLTRERNSLLTEKTQLLTKMAEEVNARQFIEVVDDMIDMGVLDSALKQDKLDSLMKSGVSPEVYKEAMTLVPNLYSLGHLDSAPEEETTMNNPLERAILDYVQNKTL